jgi:uncharacterized membrane protein
VPRRRLPGGRGAFLFIHFALCGLATAYALHVAAGLDVTLRPGMAVDAPRQIASALAEPLRFTGVVIADYVRHAPRYGAQLVGKLGWADVSLPTSFLVAYAGLLLALVFLDASPRIRMTAGQRLVLAVAVLAILGLVSASQYAVWTPYGADFIDGIQGRYFLPIVTAGAWLCHTRELAGRVPVERWSPGLVAAVSVAISLAVSVATLVARYYG